MKKMMLVLSLSVGFVPAMFFAQELAAQEKVGLKVDGVDASENTTIEIKKGDKAKIDKQYEITEGTDELTGDAAALVQDARKNWKKACDEWKKEFKDLNKDNMILSMSCGSMSCTTVSMESTCKSQTKHKLRVQVK
jgi:hypothetical protein